MVFTIPLSITGYLSIVRYVMPGGSDDGQNGSGVQRMGGRYSTQLS